MESWTSDNINELAQAIVKAQSQLQPAKKDKINPYFHSKYADLPACWEAVEPFREEGIAIIQCPMPSDAGTIALDTMLVHTSGQWMRSRLVMPLAKLDPQGAGSAITYARRYALGCMTGLVTDEDIDGNQPSVLNLKPGEIQIHDDGTATQRTLPRTETPAQNFPLFQAGNKPPKGHRGVPVNEIPEGYLVWYGENGPQDEYRTIAIEELDRRRGQGARG